MLMSRLALPLFFLLALALSWVVWWPLLAAHPGWGPPATPYLHLLGSLGPATAALVVAACLGGKEFSALWQRLGRWRANRVAWAFAVLGPVLLLLTGLLVDALAGREWPSLEQVLHVDEYPQLGPLALIAAEVLFYGYGEEVGWRGFALPHLIDRFGPVWASVLLSLPWAVWHLPLLLRNETYTSMNPALLLGWFFSLLTGALLMTWLYGLGGGSLPVLAVFHGLLDVAMVNAAMSPLALTIMGAVVTVWGVFALGALHRSPPSRGL